MQRQKITSKMLISIGYDPFNETLEVELPMNQKQLVRPVYQYLDVPPEIYANLMEAESKGRYFLLYIKRNYKFKRVEEPVESTKETSTEKPEPPEPETPPKAA